jgi:hypothetical protein
MSYPITGNELRAQQSRDVGLRRRTEAGQSACVLMSEQEESTGILFNKPSLLYSEETNQTDDIRGNL